MSQARMIPLSEEAESIERHSDFYKSDGDIVIRVENTLFRVRQQPLDALSAIDRQGTSGFRYIVSFWEEMNLPSRTCSACQETTTPTDSQEKATQTIIPSSYKARR